MRYSQVPCVMSPFYPNRGFLTNGSPYPKQNFRGPLLLRSPINQVPDSTLFRERSLAPLYPYFSWNTLFFPTSDSIIDRDNAKNPRTTPSPGLIPHDDLCFCLEGNLKSLIPSLLFPSWPDGLFYFKSLLR